MGMFSEIATENNVRHFVEQIRNELNGAIGSEAQVALKRLGRWALEQFEWSTPEWAKEFEERFKET